jgi:hypothetical protein
MIVRESFKKFCNPVMDPPETPHENRLNVGDDENIIMYATPTIQTKTPAK